MSNEVYMQMKDIALEGNMIDNGWLENLKYENSKTNLNAVMILSEIVYWYRPTEVREEETLRVVGYRKKFASDKLQVSYQALADRFGLSKRQIKDACDVLRDKKLITIEFRTIVLPDGRKLNNVMYVEPVVEELKKITGISRVVKAKPLKKQSNVSPITLESNSHSDKTEEDNRSNVTPPTIESETNTKTTTKTSTEISSLVVEGGEKDTLSLSSVDNLVTLFEENICELKPTTKKQFKTYCAKYSSAYIEAVVTYCAEVNIESFAGFKTVINGFIENGATTPEGIDKHVTEYRNKKKPAKGTNTTPKNKPTEEQKVAIKVWEKANSEIMKELTEVSYNTWLKNLKAVKFESGVLTLVAQNDFTKGIVSSRYKDIILNDLKESGTDVSDINIEVEGENNEY